MSMQYFLSSSTAWRRPVNRYIILLSLNFTIFWNRLCKTIDFVRDRTVDYQARYWKYFVQRSIEGKYGLSIKLLRGVSANRIINDASTLSIPSLVAGGSSEALIESPSFLAELRSLRFITRRENVGVACSSSKMNSTIYSKQHVSAAITGGE